MSIKEESNEEPMFIGVPSFSNDFASAENASASSSVEVSDCTQDSKNQEAEKKTKCPECSRSYTCPDKLLRHIRHIHRGENPFQCSMCDYGTYNSVLFRDHVNIHKGVKPYKCKFCSFSCVSKKNLQKHEQRHNPNNPLACKVKGCLFLGRNRQSYFAHIKNEHKNDPPDIEMAQLFKCKKCGFESSDMEVYTKHRSKHIQCNECKQVLYSLPFYKNHIETVHKTKYKPFKNKHREKKKNCILFTCAICKWESNVKQKILLHLIHHPNQSVDETEIDISILRENGIMT